MDNGILHRLLQNEVLMPLLIFAGIVSIVTVRSVCGLLRDAARERTKREIAAFIAEGSITAEQGERLLRANPPRD